MAFIIKDRVKEGTTSTGTGAVTLGGAVATFDTFQSYMTNGDTTYYAIVHTTSGVDEWEVGLGTWNTGNTLTRTTVLAGSNGASAQDFSAGTKDVFMTYPAAHAALAEDDVTFANITVTGTVDGRDVAADGTKLDGIDTSADVTDATTVAAAGALMKSGGTMTGALILSADPSAALGAATKEYVDTIASSGIHYHDPVRVEHPSNINATYNNGSSGVGATLTNAGSNAAIQLDGVSLALNDRVLVSNQTNEAHNGVYKVTTVGDGSTAWVLTRTVDADSYAPSDPDAFGKGDAFFIKEGDTNAGHLDVLTTAGTITFGTTNIHFAEVAETAVYSAGTGITLTGDVFSIGQSVGTSDSVTFSQVTAAIIGNVTGNVTGDVTGNAATATALATARTIQLTGDVTGSATFDGSANASITATVQDDSHSHVISNVDGLQTALDSKTDETRTITAGNGLTGGGNLTANRTISHADTSTVSDVNGSGNTFIQDIGFDTYGHVTSVGTGTVTVGDGAMTVTAGSGLTGGGQVGTANQSGASSVTVSHADTSSQGSVNNSNGTVIQDITLDTYGHLTGINSVNLDDRYYTESEADSRFVNASGDTLTGTLNYRMLSGQGTSNYDTAGDSSGFSVFYGASAATNKPSGVDHAVATFSFSGAWQTQIAMDWRTNKAYLRTQENGTWKGWNQFFTDGYHPNADKWTTARTLSLSGDASGSTSWDGSGNASISVTVADDSHSHSNYLRSDANDSLVPSGWASPMTHAALNIGYSGSGETRAIDIDGGWAPGENKCISFTHGSNADNIVGQFRVKYDSPGSRMQFGRLYHAGDSSIYPMELVSTSTTAADLYISGNGVFAGDVTTNSDVRLKSNINTITNAVDTVKSLRGTSYIKDDKPNIGLIAQEVEEVMPFMVRTASDEMGTKSVNYQNMVALLIEAIKEQQVQIDELKAQLNS